MPHSLDLFARVPVVSERGACATSSSFLLCIGILTAELLTLVYPAAFSRGPKEGDVVSLRSVLGGFAWGVVADAAFPARLIGETFLTTSQVPQIWIDSDGLEDAMLPTSGILLLLQMVQRVRLFARL